MEKKYGLDSNFNYSDNTISFSTSEEINRGLNLEELLETNYYLFLKVTYSNSDIKYYSLANASDYSNTTYYTISKDNTNNKIDIEFSIYNEIQYMSLNVSKVEGLPDDVYDIAIDPGHGGQDAGAITKDYKEAKLVLENALILKSKLEDLGLKVFLSRDENSSPNENTASNMYDENGRVNIINESKAKLGISLHINENIYNKKMGGLEVYAPSNCNLDFATMLAKNIVENADTYYSEYNVYKKSDGVYVRNYTKPDIIAAENKAKKANYEPYNITTSTPYLYIIRETGGICTNAYVDGRNKSYGSNKYYNSNTGIEFYQIELGYMRIEQDLNNIVKNSENYMEAIAQSIKLNYNL